MTAMPKLPQPLTPQSLVGLMREPAYWDSRDPQFPTYQRLVKRGFEILYPGPVRRSDTGNMIDAPPLAPHIVAHQVDAVNREMAAMEEGPTPETGSDKTHDGMVHVESHVRDGGKTEVSDYWRNAPGHGDGAGESSADHADGADKGAPENQNDPNQDTLPGQSGEDDLTEAKDAPKGAYQAKTDKLKEMLDEIKPEKEGKWFYRQDEKEENRYQCTALVKAAIPEIGPASTWHAGEKLVGPGNPPLQPGTAIATFDKNGKYTSTSGESHAGIFLEYGTHNGKDGMWIMDQHQGQEAQKTFLVFNDPGRRRTYQAERYSVVRGNP